MLRMDGGTDRDTLPGTLLPEYIECEHCGCEAAVGEAPIGVDLDCISCGHPGKVEIDTTGAPAWFLRHGRCVDSKCGNCNPGAGCAVRRLADEAKAQFHLIDESLFALPDARMLTAKARELGEGLGGLPPDAALCLLVDCIRDDLAKALGSLGAISDLARKLLQGGVVEHEVLQ